ncbi:MAG: class I SAM-dependent methyltransferase [Chlamydiia bacterium]|nr:class I SAM-dependent methyltransferase [Chlamydiia bacterium]
MEKQNRNILSAIKLFQLFGGILPSPEALGISLSTLQTLLERDLIIPHGPKGFSLSPLPSFLLPAPYNQVEEPLPFNGHNYFNKDSVMGLGALLRENKIETVVELGCWQGISTIFMATFLPSYGRVYAVDHWKGSAEHTQDCSHLYHQFLSNVIRTRLTDQIIPLKMTTLEASKRPFPPIDLLYVDASHDETSVFQDLEAWYPLIQQSGGILCGDDFLWGQDKGFPIQKALKRFTQKHHLQVESQGTFWRIIKI